uniref:Centromere protein S n=1 Tax=Solanum lycopersicum TaxID=4081 RepID=A0A3Q7HFL9_SOLLC
MEDLDGGMASDVEREEEEAVTDLLRDRFRLCTISIAEDEAKQCGMEVSQPIITCISDLAFKFAEQLSKDLELFAQHAGRKSVNMEDVILSAHRNDHLAASLRSFCNDLKTKERNSERKRKKNPKREDIGASSSVRCEFTRRYPMVENFSSPRSQMSKLHMHFRPRSLNVMQSVISNDSYETFVRYSASNPRDPFSSRSDFQEFSVSHASNSTTFQMHATFIYLVLSNYLPSLPSCGSHALMDSCNSPLLLRLFPLLPAASVVKFVAVFDGEEIVDFISDILMSRSVFCVPSQCILDFMSSICLLRTHRRERNLQEVFKAIEFTFFLLYKETRLSLSLWRVIIPNTAAPNASSSTTPYDLPVPFHAFALSYVLQEMCKEFLSAACHLKMVLKLLSPLSLHAEESHKFVVLIYKELRKSREFEGNMCIAW